MTRFHIEPAANASLDAIYDYSCDRWDEIQADRYIRGLFACFQTIAAREIIWRPISTELQVRGYFCRYQSHVVYWKLRADGDVAIAAILHERMNAADRLAVAFEA